MVGAGLEGTFTLFDCEWKASRYIEKGKKNESLTSFAIHVLYVKYQRVSRSDKVEGRMSHILRLQMKRRGRKGNFRFHPAVSTMCHRQVMGRVRGEVFGGGRKGAGAAIRLRVGAGSGGENNAD